MRFERPGIVRVFCDIHSHMSAFVLVFSHPFYATTDADGRYRIDNVPPGTYTVAAWHEGRVARHADRHRFPAQGGDGGSRFPRPMMRAASSLTNRIFLASTLLATLSLGFAFYFVNARVYGCRPRPTCAATSTDAATLVEQHRQ